MIRFQMMRNRQTLHKTQLRGTYHSIKCGLTEKKFQEIKSHGPLGFLNPNEHIKKCLKNSQETFSSDGVLGQSAPFSHGTGSHTSPTKHEEI